MKRTGLLCFLFVGAGFSQDNPKSLREQELRKRIEALNARRNQAMNERVCSIPLLEALRPPKNYKLKVIPQTQQEKTAPVPAPPCNESEIGR